jgi:hypothetical protein
MGFLRAFKVWRGIAKLHTRKVVLGQASQTHESTQFIVIPSPLSVFHTYWAIISTNHDCINCQLDREDSTSSPGLVAL